MKRLFLLVCMLGLSLTTAASEINIVPKPLRVEPAEGSFTVTSQTPVVAGQDKELLRVGRLFAGMVEPVVGRNLPVKKSTDDALRSDWSRFLPPPPRPKP